MSLFNVFIYHILILSSQRLLNVTYLVLPFWLSGFRFTTRFLKNSIFLQTQLLVYIYLSSKVIYVPLIHHRCHQSEVFIDLLINCTDFVVVFTLFFSKLPSFLKTYALLDSIILLIQYFPTNLSILHSTINVLKTNIYFLFLNRRDRKN